MKDKIEQAKQQLGLTDRELSLKLGYSDRYIARKLKTPPSAKTQELIIYRINELLGESELNALKKELEHKNQVLDKRNDLYADAEYKINALEAELALVKAPNQQEVEELQQTIKHLHAVLNKRSGHIYELSEKTDRIRALKKQMLNERLVFGLVIAVAIVVGFLSVVIS